VKLYGPIFYLFPNRDEGMQETMWFYAVAYPGILFGEGSTNSVEDRGQNGNLGAVPP